MRIHVGVLQRHEAIAREAKYDDARDVVERALHAEELVAKSEPSERFRPVVHAPSAMSGAKTREADARLQRNARTVRATEEILLHKA